MTFRNRVARYPRDVRLTGVCMSFTRWNQLRESNSDDARHTPKESIPLNRLAIVIRPPFYPVQKKTKTKNFNDEIKSFFFSYCLYPPLSKVSSTTTTIQPKKRKKKNENRILKIELERTKCEQEIEAQG